MFYKFARSLKKNQKGFTLVELMVVVVIIGILIAIAIPVYNAVTARAERGSVEANLRTIDGAIMMYYAGEVNPAALEAVADLVPAYLAVEPAGPGTAVYDITGEAPNQRATVAAAAPGVGGHTIATAVTLENLPW